jgi:hypothetical protein
MTSIRTMPIRTLLTIVGILATMLMVLLTAPDSAFAQPTGDHLKGYKCERAGVNSWICKKPGAPTLVCDNDGRCAKWKITRPGSGPPPAGGNAGIAPPTHTPVGGTPVGGAPPAAHTPVGVAPPPPPKPQSLETLGGV